MKKTILCYGDSNTWGWIPENGERYSEKERWPAILAERFRDSYNVIEMGQNGRTTVWDDPVEIDRNGWKQLVPIMECCSPLDLLIIMLGTNDCRERFGVNGFNIALSISKVAIKAKQTLLGPDHSSPKILVVNPPYIQAHYRQETVNGPAFGENADLRSKDIGKYLPSIIHDCGCEYWDSNEFVETSRTDGIHLSIEGHKRFADGISKKILEMLL